jgi:glycosyltransferase involved in cell wall biosynthesis
MVRHGPVKVSLIIPAKDESANILGLLNRIPPMGQETEIIFIEGNSTDHTYETMQQEIHAHPEAHCILLRQPGTGKWDAVRFGLEYARGDILVIFDSDLSVSPGELPHFVNSLIANEGEFINGVRIFYPFRFASMSPIKYLGNRIFTQLVSWIVGQNLHDTLCGSKAFWRKDYLKFCPKLDRSRPEDPFGDFSLLFSAARENLRIRDLPVHYHPRSYGQSKTQVFRHGMMLFKLLAYEAKQTIQSAD